MKPDMNGTAPVAGWMIWIGWILCHINSCGLFNIKSYIYVYIYEVHTISFQTFFIWAFKIVVDSRKFSMLLLYILKMQSDTLEERYAIRFCFKLGKNATETFGMLQTAFRPSCMNWASVFEWHKRFKEGRESARDDDRCGRSKEVNTPELIAKGLRLGLLCWDFKGVQEEIPWEEASTLQIGSVAFPPGQCTSPQLHPCHRLFDQDGHQDSSSPSL